MDLSAQRSNFSLINETEVSVLLLYFFFTGFEVVSFVVFALNLGDDSRRSRDFELRVFRHLLFECHFDPACAHSFCLHAGTLHIFVFGRLLSYYRLDE